MVHDGAEPLQLLRLVGQPARGTDDGFGLSADLGQEWVRKLS